MAEVHLDAAGTATAPEDTWAKAFTTVAGAIAGMSAGDQLDMGSAFAEAGSSITWNFPGSSTSITKLLSGTKGATSGLTALSTAGAATLESTNATFNVNGSFYAEGIHWKSSGSGISTFPAFAGTTGNQQYHRRCLFNLASTGAGSSWTFGSTSGGVSVGVILDECGFKFGNAAHRIFVAGQLSILNGSSINAGGTSPSGLFTLASGNRSCRLLVDDFDASLLASSGNIITSITQTGTYVRLRRWKMPSAWSGSLVTSGQIKRGDRIELIDYSVGSTRNRLWAEDYAGTIKDETTVKVTANSYSYKVISNADCSIIAPLRGPSYFVPLSGSSQTLTIDILTDNVTLTDAEACIEISYFASSGDSLGTVVTDAAASVIASPANQATSTTTWTTGPLSTPVKQALSTSVTAGLASYAIVRPMFRKASTTVYIDDRVQVA